MTPTPVPTVGRAVSSEPTVEKEKIRADATSNQTLQGPNGAGIIAAIIILSLLCCALFFFYIFRYYRRNKFVNEHGFGKQVDKEISSWIQSNNGSINLMKRQGDDFLDVDGVKEHPRHFFSAVNNLRVNSQRLGSVFGLGPNMDNPMKSPSTAESKKKRVTSGEFHMNYLGYESTTDLSSSNGNIVSDPSKIRLDQDRSSEVVVDPFRSTFPSQRSLVTTSYTI